MKELIKDLQKQALSFKIDSREDLEAFRMKFLVKKGMLNDLFSKFRELDGQAKKEFGGPLNDLKQKVQSIYDDKSAELLSNEAAAGPVYDDSLPGLPLDAGSRHPISIVLNQMIDVFMKMGFSISEGPEVEDDWHNFTALNFPENHPARDMQDTFFIDEDFSLRTHTSSVQVRVMESEDPPIRTISPGRVYRNEAISARSNSFFHQIEGLYIDKGVSFADLKQTLYLFVQEFFGEGTKVRFRPSYFPFTEPSAEMDIYLGVTTEEDRRLTKGSGWLEILGCGMVDENVLRNNDIDPETYSGFAFGMGVERITLFKYGVKDLRIFFENDIRFLRQFQGEE